MRLSHAQKLSLREATEWYAMQVDDVEAYLAGRGIPLSVAVTYRLGVVTTPRSGDEDMTGRLTIPYIAANDVITDLRFRAVNADQTPKYLSRPNSQTRMFNTRALITDSPVVVVCEGELDALVMDGIVGVPAVGVPGVQNWKKHYSLLLEDFDRVLVFCDGDKPGREFGRFVCGELENARSVHMPDDVDVNEALLAFGVDWLREKAS